MLAIVLKFFGGEVFCVWWVGTWSACADMVHWAWVAVGEEGGYKTTARACVCVCARVLLGFVALIPFAVGHRYVSSSVCACVCASVYMRACVCVCARVRVFVRVRVFSRLSLRWSPVLFAVCVVRRLCAQAAVLNKLPPT